MKKNHTKKTSTDLSIYPILTVNFVGTLGFSIVLPFLVFLVTRFGGNAIIYGVMGASYSVFQLIGAPILGRWSDVYGRKRVLLFSQLGTLFSWVIFLIAMNLPQTNLLSVDSKLLGAFSLTLPIVILFLARSFDGLTGGNVSVANAYLADITPDDKRSQNFGKMAVSANIGFIFGPALAGILGATALKETLPVLSALLISLIAVFIIIFLLPESKKCVIKKNYELGNVRKVFGQEHKDCYEMGSENNLSLKDALKQPLIPTILVIYFLIFLAFNFFYISFPVHAVQKLNWQLTDTGIYFSFMGLCMAIVQGPILLRVSKIWPEYKLIMIGSLLLSFGFLTYISSKMLLIYGGALLIALGNGVMWPSVLSLLSQTTDQKYQGIIQGFASSSGSMASIIGLLLGGVLYAHYSTWTFSLSSLIILLVFIISLTLIKYWNKNPKPILN